MIKCNLFVQVVILNIEFLKMYSFVALTCFSQLVTSLITLVCLG